MKVIPTELAEVLLLEPKIHEDARGITYESYNQRIFREAIGSDVKFVQENRSRSVKHTIRGLHYQLGHPQGKLVGVLAGELFDVAVDLRRSSRTFGKWAGFRLSGREHRYAWIPPGFGHGFLALKSETTSTTALARPLAVPLLPASCSIKRFGQSLISGKETLWRPIH